MTYRIRRYGSHGFALRLDNGRSAYFGRRDGDYYRAGGELIWREAGLRKLEGLGLFKFDSGKCAPTIAALMAGGARVAA